MPSRPGASNQAALRRRRGGESSDMDGSIVAAMSARRAALFLALPALFSACSSSAPAPAPSDGGQLVTFPHPSIRDVDVLFVVDDAPGMAPAQARLLAGVKAFTDT